MTSQCLVRIRLLKADSVSSINLTEDTLRAIAVCVQRDRFVVPERAS